MLGAVVGLLVVLWLLPIPLAAMPEPIGPAAVQFGNGARMTVLLTLASGILGLIVGVIVALMRLSHQRLLQRVAHFWLWIIRRTPLLVHILFVHFARPALLPGLDRCAFGAAGLAPQLSVGSYCAQV